MIVHRLIFLENLDDPSKLWSTTVLWTKLQIDCSSTSLIKQNDQRKRRRSKKKDKIMKILLLMFQPTIDLQFNSWLMLGFLEYTYRYYVVPGRSTRQRLELAASTMKASFSQRSSQWSAALRLWYDLDWFCTGKKGKLQLADLLQLKCRRSSYSWRGNLDLLAPEVQTRD